MILRTYIHELLFPSLNYFRSWLVEKTKTSEVNILLTSSFRMRLT